MKTIPCIEKFMTTTPHTIGADASLAKAVQTMSELHVRHLPVLEGGKIVGILSDRDIKMIKSFTEVNPEKTTVRAAYTEEPYTVSPKAPLSEVCSEMASHKYSSVLVMDNHKLVGIFTWVDALNAMHDLMETRLK